MKEFGESEKETKKPKKEDAVKVNLQTFCVIKKLTDRRKIRIETFMREAKDIELEKEVSAWEDIYSQCMNQVTK
jgi:hypothetical protein